MNPQPHNLPRSSLDQPLLQLCSICYQPQPRPTPCPRPAQICSQCWYNHIKNYVTRISYRAGDDIISPFNQGPSMDVVGCLNTLEDRQSREIEEMLFKKYTAFTKEIEKCPAQGCEYVYVGQGCKWGASDNVYNCPKCDMPLTAGNKHSIKSMLASLYLLMANKCPKCDIPIEKISGCPHMTCPCGHHFCWYCYKDHPSGTVKRVYQLHSVPECIFIFLSKIVLFLICCASLLVTFNGNWIMREIFYVISVIFSILFRAVLLDGAILLQVMAVMMHRRGRFLRSSSARRKIPMEILFIVLVNTFGIGLLYFLGQFELFMTIFIGEAVLAALGFSITFAVIYSLQTWFQFVA